MAISAGLTFFVLALLLRAKQYTYDSLMFANAIRVGAMVPSDWRPHNLAYLPMAEAMGAVVNDPFLAGQLVSALFGAVAVGLFWLLARRFADPLSAAVATALFATTNAVTSQATTVEVYTVSLAATVAMALSLARRRPGGTSTGLWWAAAVLGHITNVMLALPLAAWAFARGRAGWKRFAIWSIVAGLATLAVYGCVAFGPMGAGTPRESLAWVLSSTTTQKQYGSFSPRRMAEVTLGLKRAFVDGPARALMLAHAGMLALALWGSLAAGGITRRVAAVLLVHAGVYAAFFAWWEPTNIEFWVVPMLPLCLLVVTGLRGLRRQPGARRALLVLATAALAVQLGFNGLRLVRTTDPLGDPWMTRAAALRNRLKPADLVVTFNDPQIFTLPLAAAHDNVFEIDGEAGAAEASLLRSMATLRERVGFAERDGGLVYLTAEGAHPPEVMLARLAVTFQEYQTQLAAALPRGTAALPGS